MYHFILERLGKSTAENKTLLDILRGINQFWS